MNRPKVGGKAAVNGRAGGISSLGGHENIENFFNQTLKLPRELPLKRLAAVAEWQNCDKRVLLLHIIKVLSCTKQPWFLPGFHREPDGFVRQTPMGPSRRSLTENTDFLQFVNSFSTVRIYLIGNTTAADTTTGERK
ncbi:hypothetical protein HD842_004581 [Massilia aurea]|uniref:Uncharacterized protein n=1 Tax=Massilia aurea TaxID=373040 RepID=A0A7W9X4L3_9BURK|nr:hypothetical protein [Massilia aurea]MBB6136403.1 hypothetical protein [Massilia aurea]